jgi:hypothetical protein
MTKQTVPAAAPAAPARKPFSVQIVEPAYPAFQQACALIRDGYIFAPDMPVELTPQGHAIFTLILGTPDAHAFTKAQEATDHALAMEAMQYRKDVEQAAKALLEQQKRDELAKQVAALKADQEKQMRDLEKATAAAIAAL